MRPDHPGPASILVKGTLMIRNVLGRLALPAVLVAGLVAGFPTAAQARDRGIEVDAAPTYIGWWDTTQWGNFLASTGGLPNRVILNSAGNTIGSEYESLIHNLHEKGVDVLGYVDTSYGTHSAATIEAEVDTYFPSGAEPGDTTVDGIFLDQFGSYTSGVPDCNSTTLYGNVTEYIYDKLGQIGTGTVWANPGTAVRTCYLPLDIDVFVTAENSKTGYETYTPYNTFDGTTYSADSADYNRFAHLVYGVASGDVHSVIDRAFDNYAGHVFTTSYSSGNQWVTLDSNSYLDDEVDYAASLG